MKWSDQESHKLSCPQIIIVFIHLIATPLSWTNLLHVRLKNITAIKKNLGPPGQKASFRSGYYILELRFEYFIYELKWAGLDLLS